MTVQLPLAEWARNPRDEWETPQALFDEINHEGKFTIDACAYQTNKKVERCWMPEDNGLLQDWSHERVWCNPPFSEIGPWVEKCKTARLACLLVPPRTDCAWWHDAIKNAVKIDFFSGRIAFIPADGIVESSPNGSHVLIWFGMVSYDGSQRWRSRDAKTGRLIDV